MNFSRFQFNRNWARYTRMGYRDDRFTTTQNAPMTTPRVGEPAGTIPVSSFTNRLNIVDTGNQFSIASGILSRAAGTAVPYMITRYAIPWAPGRALVARMRNDAGGRCVLAWTAIPGARDVAGPDFEMDVPTVRQPSPGGGISVGFVTPGVGTFFQVAMVRLAGGGMAYIWNGQLMWISHINNQRTSRATIGHPSFNITTHSFSYDYFVVTLLGSPWTDVEGLASLNQANPISGTSYTAQADGLHKAYFTLPASPVAGDTIELRYRILDASNYMVARVTWNTGTSQWDFKLDSVVAGTPTNRLSVANVGNTVTGLAVMATGNNHNCYTEVSTFAATKRGAQATDSNQATQVNVGVVFQNTNPTKLLSYPSLAAAYTIAV